MFNPELPDIYAILDFQTCLERNIDPRATVKAWCDAGIKLIQIRAKKLTDLNYWVFAETIRDCCAPYDVTLLINARVDIAKGLELHGVHLPAAGLPAEAIRKSYPEMLIFASCHNAEEIESRHAVDAITLSPLHTPQSKPQDSRPPLGKSAFDMLASTFVGKVYALGGIDQENLSEMKGIPIASLGFLSQKNAYENAKMLISKDNS